MVCNVHFFMIFPKELTRIFFFKRFFSRWSFPLFSRLYVKFQGWEGKEKSNASHWRVKGLINALFNKQVTKTKITILLYSLQCKRLIRVSYRYKLSIVYPIGHVWFGVKVDGGGRRGGGEGDPSLSLFLTVDRLLSTNFFLSPVFRCH